MMQRLSLDEIVKILNHKKPNYGKLRHRASLEHLDATIIRLTVELNGVILHSEFVPCMTDRKLAKRINKLAQQWQEEFPEAKIYDQHRFLRDFIPEVTTNDKPNHQD